jgi:hypothetical protein
VLITIGIVHRPDRTERHLDVDFTTILPKGRQLKRPVRIDVRLVTCLGVSTICWVLASATIAASRILWKSLPIPSA